jgi:hypothetical protein
METLMLDRINSSDIPALAAVNLREAAKGRQRATFDLELTALGVTLCGCVLRRHDGHAWVDMPQSATGVVSYMPDGRRQFQQAALAAISAAMALAGEAV